MRGKRLWYTVRLFTIFNANKRTAYYKKKCIFHSMGDNCLIMDRKVPLYADLISIGNNVQIASDVHFLTHDVTHLMLNNLDKSRSSAESGGYPEKLGCIEIGDNVFIGTGTHIGYNVKIGSNVIIAACSMITKDIPDNCVVGGVPARVISSFEEYLDKRKNIEFVNKHFGMEELDADLSENIWAQFHEKRNRST